MSGPGEEERGVSTLSKAVEDRGVFPKNPPYEEVGLDFSDEDDDEGADEDKYEDPIAGCDRLPAFPPREEMDGETLRRLEKFTGMYYIPGFDGTACLINAVRAIHGNLLAVGRQHPKAYPRLLERLVDLHGILKARTEKPYKLAFDSQPRRPLPKAILEVWPFPEADAWIQNRAAVKRGKGLLWEPILIVPDKPVIDADEESKQPDLDAAMADLEARIAAAKPAGTGLGATPEVRKALATLAALTLKDIERQTGVQFKSPYADVPVIQSLECFFYHGAHTVVLDRHGEPTTLNGLLRYPILIPDPGSVMERNLQPHGLYLSVQKYGFGDFRIGKDGIKKMLFGGIGGLVENHGGGVRVPHAFQVAIQTRLDGLGHAYAASLMVDSAFKPGELGYEKVKRKFGELVEATYPYALKEIGQRLGRMFRNWDEIARQVGEEALKEIIRGRIKEKIRAWLIKKIGTKIIPLVNLASALYDLFEGEEERLRVRNAIGCILLHVRGSSADDLHIAAKTLAKILADKFEDALIEAVTRYVAKQGSEALQRRGKDDKGGQDDPSRPKPGDPGDPGQAAPTGGSAKPDQGGSGQGTGRPMDPAPPPPASPKGTQGTATDVPLKNDTGTTAPGTGGTATRDPATGSKPTDDKGTRPDQNAKNDPAPGPKGKGEEGEEADPPKPAAKKGKPGEEEEETGSRQQKVTRSDKPGKGEGDEGGGKPRSQAPRGRQDNQGRQRKPKDMEGDEETARKQGRGTADPKTQDTRAGDAPPDPAKERRKRDRARRRIMRRIMLRQRLERVWGEKAKVIQDAIGNRQKLRESFGNVAPHLFAHHLLPVTVLKSHPVAQAAVVGGYDFNGRKNGALLNHPEHYGGHDAYNQRVKEELDAFAQRKPNYTPAEAAAFIEKRKEDWKDELLRGGEFIPVPGQPGVFRN